MVCGASTDNDSDTGDEGELRKQDVVDKVHKFIQEACGCVAKNVPKEVVIPVFGIWAYRARMLAKEPHSEVRKKKVVKTLSRFSNQPCGQGEGPETILSSTNVVQLATQLQDHSNILELEQR